MGPTTMKRWMVTTAPQQKQVSQDCMEHQHWGRVRTSLTTMGATESLLNEVREKQIQKLYEDDWTKAATPTTQSPHWNKVRNNVNAMLTAEALLNEVRAHQTEDLF